MPFSDEAFRRKLVVGGRDGARVGPVVGNASLSQAAHSIVASSLGSFPQTVTFAALAATDRQPNDYKWQTAIATTNGDMGMWGTGDHNFWYGLSGDQSIGVVRLFKPATGSVVNLQSPAGDTSPGNAGVGHGNPVSNQDNLNYFRLPGTNKVVIPGYGVFDLDVEGASGPLYCWTHGNSESGGGTPDNGGSWSAGSYWSDFLTNWDTSVGRKNSFLATHDGLGIAICLGNGVSGNQDNVRRVVHKPASTWTTKVITITGWSPASFNRNCIAIKGNFAYFGGGKTAADTSTRKFWRLDLSNVASKSDGGSTDAGALVSLADFPVDMGDAPGSVGWVQLTYDAVFDVCVLTYPSAVRLYNVATDVWSGAIVPSGYSMGTGYVHGIYSASQGKHYYRPDGTTGTIMRLGLS